MTRPNGNGVVGLLHKIKNSINLYEETNYTSAPGTVPAMPVEATLSRKHAVTPRSSRVLQIPYKKQASVPSGQKIKRLKVKLREAQNQGSELIAQAKKIAIRVRRQLYFLLERIESRFCRIFFFSNVTVPVRGPLFGVQQCTLLH